jgi:hypothetical protein
MTSLHGTDHWDPIWAVCEEAGLPVSMHIGSSGYVPIADDLASFSGVIASSEVTSMLSMVNLLISDVPHKFPEIKLVFSEGGIGWVPAMLQRTDRQVERHSGWAGKLKMKPSEIFARNMWCCMVEEPLGLSLYPHIGAEKILSETDYPHADTTFPNTQHSFASVFDGIPDDVVEMVSHTNAEHIFNWKMADENLLTEGRVSAWRTKLNDDPYAAMGLRHEVTGIDHIAASTDRCGYIINTASLLAPCGQPIGPDGICTAGHAIAHV